MLKWKIQGKRGWTDYFEKGQYDGNLPRMIGFEIKKHSNKMSTLPEMTGDSAYGIK